MGSSRNRWSREEIEETFQHHQDVVVEIGKAWDWSRYGDLFTEDATYTEHLYDKMATAAFTRRRASPSCDTAATVCGTTRRTPTTR
jgi:hypothetical protein